MTRFSFAVLAVYGLTASSVFAQRVVENVDRFEMNWSTMRLRYFGESATGKALDLAEKEATDQGLLYALANVPKIRAEKGASVDGASDIANAVSKQSYTYNTVYFSNGKVRVELESNLALALDPGRKPFAPVETNDSAEAPTSLVIRVSGLTQPSLVEEIKDSSGETAYSSQDVSPEAYRKSLLGKWFYANSPELRSFAGSKTHEIEATYQNGRLVVEKSSWESFKKGGAKALRDARVAFVLSRPN